MIRPAPAPLLALLLLAGCASSEEASLVQPDSNQGYNKVNQVSTPEQDDLEPAIGQWRQSLQQERPALEFGPSGTEPLFSLLCTEARGVLLQRHGGVPTGGLPQMQVTIGNVSERFSLTASSGTAIPMMRAELAAGSGMMAALAAAGQPILVRLDEASPLVMPPSPLIGAYVRSCAAGEAAQPPIGNSAAAANAAAPAQAPAPANTAAPRQQP